MKVKTLCLIATLVIIQGCATKPYLATEQDINYYFTNQKLEINTGLIHHEEYGDVKYTHEKYNSDYEACLKDSFKGTTLTFGSVNVSDPHILVQMNNDYLLLTIQSLLGLELLNPNAPQNKIFNDKNIIEELKKADPPHSATIECTQSKGWSFPVRSKK